MTSKSQEPLTRPDKPIAINSDVKVFEALHGPVLRDWPSYHIHEVIAWYAWHAPADGVRGREARVGGIEDGVWRWAQRTGRGPGGWPACARPRLSPGVLVQDSHRSPDSTADIASETPTPGIFKASTASVPAAVLGTLAVLAVSAIVGAWLLRKREDAKIKIVRSRPRGGDAL